MLPPAVLPPQLPLDCGDRIGTLSATTPEAREASHSCPETTTDSCSNDLSTEWAEAGVPARTAPKAAPATRPATPSLRSIELPFEEAWNNALFGRKNKDLLAVVTADGTADRNSVGQGRQEQDGERDHAGGQGGLALLPRNDHGLLLERLVHGVGRSRGTGQNSTESSTGDETGNTELTQH